MIRGKVTVTDKDLGFKALKRRFRQDVSEVKIGVHADEEQTLLVIAAANEFGATINHPGGTSYGYKTSADAKKGRVRFLKGGQGFMALGKTKPHKIIIPPRPYIRSTVDENLDLYNAMIVKLGGQIVDGTLSKFEALERVGMQVESDIKRKMTTLKTPPNAASTVRKKKGNDNPLIDSGHLRSSIRYVVE